MTSKPQFVGQRVRLGDVVKIEKAPTPSGNSIWMLNLDAVEKDTGRVIIKNRVKAESVGISTVAFTANAVLYSKLRPNLNKVVVADEPGLATSEMLPLITNPKILDRHYLAYLLRSSSFVNLAVSSTAGSKMPRVNKKTLLNAVFSIPNLELQHQRVDQLSSIEEAQAKAESIIVQLDSLVKSRFVEMFGNPKLNPFKWPVKPLSEVCETRLGKMLDTKRQTGESLFPYLANTNVQWFRFDLSNLKKMNFSEEDQSEFQLKSGDILVTEGGEIGRCAIWRGELSNCFFQKAIHRVRCDKNQIIPEYFVWLFKMKSELGLFDSYVSQSTIAHLTGKKIKQVPMPLPPVTLQKEFADFTKQADKSRFAMLNSTLKTLYTQLMESLA